MTRNSLSSLLLLIGAVLLIGDLTAGRVQAYPPYAKKEGVSCAYCHVRASGGGKRNYRGVYYKMHDLSFASFDDAAEAKKAGVDIAPEANLKPASLTAPAAAEAPKETVNRTVKPNETPKPNEPSKFGGKGKTEAAAAKLKKAEAAYKKAPKNPALKKAYAAALANLGHATMLDQSIPPRTRYPAALRLDRRALLIDPRNAEAHADEKAIVDAYKSMGRPVPK